MNRRATGRRTEVIAALCAAALLAAAGCASVDATRDGATGGRLVRPDRIIVHDFAATPEALPSWSRARSHYSGSSQPPSADDLAAGRELGAKVAEELVERINDLGVRAVRAADEPGPRESDIVLVGYFTSMDEGSRLARMAIGFGAGAPEIATHVEGYQMRAEGLELVGSGSTDSKSGKGPGLVVPALVTVATANPIGIAVGGAVKIAGEASGRATIEGTAKRTADAIAEVLEARMKEEGWI